MATVTTETTEERRSRRAWERAQQWRQKMSGKSHGLFGPFSPGINGTAYSPFPFLMAHFAALRLWVIRRAARDGAADGLSGRLRAARLEECWQSFLVLITERDYAAERIFAGEDALAFLTAAGIMRRARWNAPGARRDAQRETEARKWYPSERARAAGTPNPARVAAAAEDFALAFLTGDGRTLADSQQTATEAIMGPHGQDEAPADPVTVPGGPSGRGPTEGRMERYETVVRSVATPCVGDERYVSITEEIETGWRMIRGRGRAKSLPACTVRDSRAVPRPTFTGPAPAPAPVPGMHREGIVNAAAPADGWTDVTEPGERAGGIRHYVRLQG